ncbi:MAG: alpha/beta hydrolase [Candidatus Omnitrophica bacterium]|nr:alpha/beta hydrolase [Candidatus Omnitrophota bacterium]MCA9415654.1 alpha/beta hydrolase [Candidatus Omnitrophota bacterium]MCA9423618.1 alpha/beta hydrolase [Candidatus Omnitrophota bacterium]MCA9431255.1 alpha/beta hydrolase [Candidatus Omnitrophota bacterium]MCA9434342.1 alpha/beta hydrolase [Candidatus Omnitrophota bacterium]
MPFFDHEGIRFNYVTHGEGTPIILNHGLSGDHSQPEELLGEVEGYRTIFWDCRGHGETEPMGPPEGFTFRNFARDLWTLMEELDLPDAVVGGISMGAALSTRFALDHPDRVRALLIIRPAWLASPNPPNLEVVRVAAEVLGKKGVQGALDHHEAFCSIPEAFHCTLQAQIEKPKAVERRLRLSGMSASCPIGDWSEAEAIDCPTLVIGNDDDPVHPMEFAETWAEKIRGAKLVKVYSKSDDLEKHNQEVRQAILQFLEEHGMRNRE